MNKKIRLLLAISALALLANGLMSPIYAAYVEGLGGDLLTTGATFAAFAIAAGILTFIISRWEDHTKHLEKFVVINLFLSVLGYAGYLLVKTPAGLFAVQVIFGIGLAIGAPAYDGVYSMSLNKRKCASQWGLWEGMNWIVVAVAASVGGFIAQTYGFRTLLIAMLTISIVSFLISLLLLRKK